VNQNNAKNSTLKTRVICFLRGEVMNLERLSNEELALNLQSLISKEREILSLILEHILEIDRRKFYLKMAYSSLFDYLTKHLGYSAGSAQRRIDAARLMKDVPELSEKLENGSLNLSQVSLVQKAIRQKKVQIINKLEILESLEHKSFFDSQSIVSKAFDLDLKEETKITNQKDESIRLEITLSKEQWEKLQQMKSLLPNGSGSWDEVFEYLADQVIEKKTKARTKPKPAAKRVNISMRKHIRNRDQCCQHKDKITGRICGTKLNLQIDHIKPLWAGGTSTIENLQLLCANHNRYRYRQQANLLLRSCTKGLSFRR
jgi:hypothetical protein